MSDTKENELVGEKIDMSLYISKLKEIKKDELSKKDFYAKVLAIVQEVDDKYHEEYVPEFVAALREIGCRELDEFSENEKAKLFGKSRNLHDYLGEEGGAITIIGNLLHTEMSTHYAHESVISRGISR